MTRTKYGAKKTTVDGIVFDSQAEARRYQELKLMERAGLIQNLRVHVPYTLTVNSRHVCFYEADFSYHRVTAPDSTVHVLEDVKGYRKGSAWAMFRLKAALFKAIHGYEIEVYPPAPPRAPRKAKR